MFRDFIRLRDAVGHGTVAEEWEALSRERIFGASQAGGRDGHIPVADFWSVQDKLGEVLNHAGLYVFGSWTGADARLQYVGIAHGYSLGDRFRGRYMGSPTPGTRRWTEIKFAAAHRDLLVLVPDHFSPRRPIVANTFTSRGIPVPTTRGLRRRIVRAERYAKNGLEKTWFYLIPAPPATTKKELEAIEKELIQASNAYLYRLNAVGRSAPLLNVVHARSRSNGYVCTADLDGYNAWIDGSWWSPAHSP